MKIKLVILICLLSNLCYSQINEISTYKNLVSYLQSKTYSVEYSFDKEDDIKYGVLFKYEIKYKNTNDYLGISDYNLCLYFNVKDNIVIPLTILIDSKNPDIWILKTKNFDYDGVIKTSGSLKIKNIPENKFELEYAYNFKKQELISIKRKPELHLIKIETSDCFNQIAEDAWDMCNKILYDGKINWEKKSEDLILYEKGKENFNNKEYSDALISFNKAISKNNNSYKYFGYRASTKFELKDYEGAISDYNSSIKLDLSNYWVEYNYFGRGKSYSRMMKYNEALNDFNKNIELNPFNYKFYNWRGYSKLYLKDYEGALSDFNKSIELDVEKKWIEDNYFGKGKVNTSKANNTEALNDINKVIDINSSNWEYYKFRAWIKYNLKDYKGSISDFEKSIELNPPEKFIAENNNGIARSYYKLNQFTESISYYEKDYQISKKNTSLGAIAICYAYLKNEKMAFSKIETAIANEPDNSYLYFQKARMFSVLKNKDESLLSFEEALKKGFKDKLSLNTYIDELNSINLTQEFKDLINQYKLNN